MQQTIEQWHEEIEAVERGIIRWYARNKPIADTLIDKWVKAYQTDNSEECVSLMQECHEITWKCVDGDNWLGHEYLYSDIFDCAVCGALDDISKQARLELTSTE